MVGGGELSGEQRRILYCVVPGELAERLHGPLRAHFADDPSIEVVVEQRGLDRRGYERRSSQVAGADDVPAETPDRRLIRNLDGRRIAERRAPAVDVELPLLPRRARRYADQLRFVERVEPSARHAEDVDTARLVTRFQAGDADVFTELYLRYFDRVYTYLRVAFRDVHEAEDATQQVFIKALQALPRYERRARPFRAWLFTIVRHYAISQLERRDRVAVVDPERLERHRDEAVDDEPQLEALDWLTDRELVMFIERLPLAQRQVLVLRFMLDMRTSEIAEVLGRSETSVTVLQSRALRFLRERLSAVGRGPQVRRDRSHMLRPTRKAHLLRRRRFVLEGPGQSRPWASARQR